MTLIKLGNNFSVLQKSNSNHINTNYIFEIRGHRQLSGQFSMTFQTESDVSRGGVALFACIWEGVIVFCTLEVARYINIVYTVTLIQKMVWDNFMDNLIRCRYFFYL